MSTQNHLSKYPLSSDPPPPGTLPRLWPKDGHLGHRMCGLKKEKRKPFGKLIWVTRTPTWHVESLVAHVPWLGVPSEQCREPCSKREATLGLGAGLFGGGSRWPSVGLSPELASLGVIGVAATPFAAGSKRKPGNPF